MRPLTIEDLLPLQEYATRRHEFFEAQTRYLDRYRRVRIGPQLTLLFANRQTLWFHLHEVLHICRLSEPAQVQEELDIYNRLLPGSNKLQAALLLDIQDKGRLVEELTTWRELKGEHVVLDMAGPRVPARLITCRPEDRAIGTAHWLQFLVGDEDRKLLADVRTPAHFEINAPHYKHQGSMLSEEIRQSLLEDLESSDRD
jgi:hypothetical protein